MRKDDTTEAYECPHSLDGDPAIYYVAKEGQWKCTSYTHVLEMLSRSDLFCNTHPGPGKQRRAAGLMMQDPPHHTELRGVVNQAFTPRALAYLAPRIRDLAHELLDKARKQGAMDVLRDLALPLTERIILEHLGFPHKDRLFIYQLGSITLDIPPKFTHYCTDVIRSHQQRRHDDTISMLLEATRDGHKLSTKEIIEIVYQLVLAGRDTSAFAIVNSIYHFSQHPEIWETLRSDPALVPSAFEEIIRLYPPFTEVKRRALTDTELAGQRIQAGQTIIGLLSPVNRDEAQFANPDDFDMQRVPNKHLSFGHGKHFCIGASLTRMEGHITLEVLLEQLPMLNVQQASEPKHFGKVFGPMNMILTF